MSYIVLARKYRPKNFAEMVGQGHVVQALSNALEQQRLQPVLPAFGLNLPEFRLLKLPQEPLNILQQVVEQPVSEECF